MIAAVLRTIPIALVALVLAGCTGGGPTAPGAPDGVWRATFSSGADGAEFSVPEAGDTGGCVRAVEEGAAVYRHPDAATSGTVRCYPVHHFSRLEGDAWKDPLEGGFTFSGRFRVSLERPTEADGGQFFSLATFLVAPPAGGDGKESEWTGLFTVNVDWSGARERPELNLFHVPDHGSGDYRQIATAEFPLDRWVRMEIRYGRDNRIEVRQDGRLVMSAEKRRAEGGMPVPLGELHAVHFGGYADARISGWEVANDDLEVRAGPP